MTNPAPTVDEMIEFCNENLKRQQDAYQLVIGRDFLLALRDHLTASLPHEGMKTDWTTITDFLTIHKAYSIPEVTKAATRIKDFLVSRTPEYHVPRDLHDVFSENKCTKDEQIACVLYLQEMRTQKMLKMLALTRTK